MATEPTDFPELPSSTGSSTETHAYRQLREAYDNAENPAVRFHLRHAAQYLLSEA